MYSINLNRLLMRTVWGIEMSSAMVITTRRVEVEVDNFHTAACSASSPWRPDAWVFSVFTFHGFLKASYKDLKPILNTNYPEIESALGTPLTGEMTCSRAACCTAFLMMVPSPTTLR